MKVVFTHTDFRIYWPARLDALNSLLTAKGIEFFVVEISGAGSPYNFAGVKGTSRNSGIVFSLIKRWRRSKQLLQIKL